MINIASPLYLSLGSLARFQSSIILTRMLMIYLIGIIIVSNAHVLSFVDSTISLIPPFKLSHPYSIRENVSVHPYLILKAIHVYKPSTYTNSTKIIIEKTLLCLLPSP